MRSRLGESEVRSGLGKGQVYLRFRSVINNMEAKNSEISHN